jgi:hypothetical protein
MPEFGSLYQFTSIFYILEIKQLIVGMFILIGVIKKPKWYTKEFC